MPVDGKELNMHTMLSSRNICLVFGLDHHVQPFMNNESPVKQLVQEQANMGLPFPSVPFCHEQPSGFPQALEIMENLENH